MSRCSLLRGNALGLNESPSQKEGKSETRHRTHRPDMASMKALPKRKGNEIASIASLVVPPSQ